MLTIVLIVILLLYILIDVHYFIRLAIISLLSKYYLPKLPLLGTSTVYGITLFSDVDIFLDHMNNARLLREFDFARFGHGIRIGMVEKIFEMNGGFPLSANFIRYRLPIKIFSIYKIETRIEYWNSKYLFASQKLITVSDGITRAVSYPKIWCYNFNGDKLCDEISPGIKSPPLETHLQNIDNTCDIISTKFAPKSKN